MVKSWLAYLLTLTCGAAFYLLYPLPLSFYTLLLLLALPLLSLGLALLSLRRLRLDVKCDLPAPAKDDVAFLRLALRGPKSLSGVEARVAFSLDNRLYPQLRRRETLTLCCNVPQTLPLPTDHCGWLSFTVEKCTLTDWMGLFSLHIKPPAPTLALVRPKSDRSVGADLDLTPAQGLPLRPRSGGGPGEDYELRPYRPGDSVTSIHWKLTAKQPTGDPILRETMEPLQEALAVTYDHFGRPEDVDALLGRLDGLEQLLLEGERPFTLCWMDPQSGLVTHYGVDCPDAWQRCCRALFAIPAPLEGQGVPKGMALTLPGHEGPVRHIHLSLPTASSEAKEVAK